MLRFEILPNPFDQFENWYRLAAAAVDNEDNLNAMALATATREGIPSVRMVLLRGWDPHGFRFFTNYESQKGRELEANPNAALVFYWRELRRQVRISGRVEKTTTRESEAYFHSRPKGSQIAASISAQSQPIPAEVDLHASFTHAMAEYLDREVERPGHWGGFRLIPDRFEFWMNGSNRVHDRVRFVQDSEGKWQTERLYP